MILQVERIQFTKSAQKRKHENMMMLLVHDRKILHSFV